MDKVISGIILSGLNSDRLAPSCRCELLPEDALNLNTDIPPHVVLATVFMVATDLKFKWESRVAKFSLPSL